MGGRTTGKKNLHSKKKGYKRSHATKSRARDIDQIQVRIVVPRDACSSSSPASAGADALYVAAG